jgi:hypothetical protein
MGHLLGRIQPDKVLRVLGIIVGKESSASKCRPIYAIAIGVVSRQEAQPLGEAC